MQIKFFYHASWAEVKVLHDNLFNGFICETLFRRAIGIDVNA
jgi:hypothetical protein